MSSVRICSGSCPPSASAPGPLLTPGDGERIPPDRPVTFRWQGSAAEYLVEYWGGAFGSSRRSSGWIQSTEWSPGTLPESDNPYYWHGRASNGYGESGWSATRTFYIYSNRPPSISFAIANGDPFPSGRIESGERNWTFQGTASDPEGQLNRVEFRCSGDNCGRQTRHEGLDNWRHDQADMAGKNDVYFEAYDDKQGTKSRTLELNIDLAPPATILSLNDDPNPGSWPPWFTGPVQVGLKATDAGTGRALSGVETVRYQVDGQGWQSRPSSLATFTVSSDGTHTVEYYAVDHVGNEELPHHSVTFKIDQTPPEPPGDVSETHGVVSDEWQKAVNTPVFTWAASSDATSGLAYYEFYFDTDPHGIAVHGRVNADKPRTWAPPHPAGVRTGTYYLRGRTRDKAGNWSIGDGIGATPEEKAWATLFVFRYDGTAPENPGEATHRLEGVVNDTWQRETSQADFTWPVPHDEGSGIKGYYLYWGDDSAGGDDPPGPDTHFTTANSFQSATPLCGTNEACTGYLRLRSLDNVDNLAEKWSTAFILRYDNAPPTADFTFNGGVTQTTQTLVTLNITANDEGSGVRAMRISNHSDLRDAQWEVFSTERPWTIPAISRQSWPVYLQVRDGVGLVSEVISHTIYLDVNPQQPRSESFRLFDHAMSAGGGEHNSAPSGYQGRSTVGQVMDSARTDSLSYTIVGGYQAGSQALPIIEPGHDEFTFINGIFASGTGADTLQSPLYRMLGTLGEVGLPNNETTLSSGGFQHQPGFLAAAPPSGTPTPTPTPGPTPTPEPTPACEFPTISINDGALFTNNTGVTLSICAPRAEEMMLSNDGGFGDAQWEPYAESKPWTITAYGQYVLPRYVYAAFKDRDGTVHGVYFDDIIYDPNPPSGNLAVEDSLPASMSGGAGVQGSKAAEWFSPSSVKYVERLGDTVLAQPLALLSVDAEGTVDLFINAMDDNSGMAEMQISSSDTFTDTAWEPYLARKPWTPEGGDGIKTVYARFRDSAGNVSAAAEAQFALDTLPPIGGIALGRRVVGPDVITTTLYLGAEDNLSGAVAMRVSEDPTFADTIWRPYTTTLTWPISLTVQTEGTLYVQYRDLAGNASEVYTDTYLVDITPPVLYVEVEAGSTLTRTLHFYAYDELAGVARVRLSNDPLMIGEVVTLPYTDTVEWTFDARRVVWVQVQDGVGNWSEPYPGYAGPACPEDLAGYDGVITAADVQTVAVLWREPVGWPYDRDGDNRVTVADIMWYAQRFGEGCP